MMADTGIGRGLTAKVRSPMRPCDRGTRSLHEEVGPLGLERTLSVVKRVQEKRKGEQEGVQPSMIVVIEQWICLVLGLACIAFGICGICMKRGQDTLPAHIAWLGLLYGPALRITAVVCIGLGIVLARRGWTHL
jgi:hypothetical protein